MRVAPGYSKIGVDLMNGIKRCASIDVEVDGIIDRICDLIDLWIDEDAIERGPDVEFDEEQDHPFDAADSDHPDETDFSWIDFGDLGVILICLRCGNSSDCCVCS
jgi:hypothetical protein